jgi:hypothetical protein
MPAPQICFYATTLDFCVLYLGNRLIPLASQITERAVGGLSVVSAISVADFTGFSPNELNQAEVDSLV